jgi:hypothetical protein
VKRPWNGSATLEAADTVQRARPEAGVEEVEDRMLDAADILIDGQPAFGDVASNGASAGWLAKRMKYQLRSTKVSSVSVSRRAAAPQRGQSALFQLGWRSSGLPGCRS